MADGDHLVPRPDSDGEGAGAAAQDRAGAVLEQQKGWNQAALMDPDGGRRAAQLGERPVSFLGCALSPTLLIFILILLRSFQPYCSDIFVCRIPACS